MTEDTCTVDDCGKPLYVRKRGLCRPHYRVWWTAQQKRTCTIDGCSKAHEAQGYCPTHYQHLRLYGDPLATAPRRNPETCTLDGCNRPFYSVGLCEVHYARQRRHGGLHDKRAERTDPVVRFEAKVTKSPGCWLWTDTANNSGYGSFRLDGRTIGAHVMAVLLDGRQVPDDMEVDHLCFTPLCVRPDHLEVVTREENQRRRRRVGRIPAA